VLIWTNRKSQINLLTYLMPEFRLNKIKVLFYEPYKPGEKYFEKTIDRMKLSETDSVLILGFGDELRSIFERTCRQKLIGEITIVGGIRSFISQ